MDFDRSRSILLALALLAGTTLSAEAQSSLDGTGAGGCTQFGVVMNCQGLGIRGGSGSTSGGGAGSESGGTGAGGGASGGAAGSGECTAGSSDVMCMLSRTFGLSDDTGVSGGATGSALTGSGPLAATPGTASGAGADSPSSDNTVGVAPAQ